MESNEWKEYRFSELVEIIGGGTPKTNVEKYWNGDIPWLSVKDFNSDNRKIYYTEKTITKEGLKNSSTNLLEEGDLIISARGTVGALAQLGRPMAFNQSCYGLKAKKITSNDFIYYLLKYKIREIKQNIHGSVFDTITRNTFDVLTAKIPNIKEQKAIANILSTLDEKIETNNKINEKLEEMAQALFKHWFVDFEFPNENGKPYKSSGGEMVDSELGMIPKGWEIKELNDVTEKANTGADAIKRAPIVDYDTGIKCVRVGDLSRGRTYKDWGYCEITEKDYKKFALQKNDIIISRTANIGLNIFVFEDMRAVFNNGLIRLKIKKSYEPLFIFALINSKAYFDYIFRINGETSTRPNMKIGYLLKYKFALPPNGIINSFVDVIKNIYAKVNLNNEENSRLIDIRDTLLPKLMSGEIRVPLDDEVLSEQN